MERKQLLRHPGRKANPALLAMWYASGPGRAWRREQWALKIGKDNPRHPLAQEALRQVREIRDCYRRGANERAAELVERLDQIAYQEALIIIIPDAKRGRKARRTTAHHKQRTALATKAKREAADNHWSNEWLRRAHEKKPDAGASALAQSARSLAANNADPCKRVADPSKRAEITRYRAGEYLKKLRAT